MDLKVTELISIISHKNAFQAKNLNGLMDKLSQEEKEGLTALITFYVKQGDTIEHLADCYLKLIKSLIDGQMYFMQKGHNRFSNAEETSKFIYQNSDNMEWYIKGLAMSRYLLEQNRMCREWYCNKISTLPPGEFWLEAGMGHGEDFVQAIRHTNYKHYLGIDLSPTAVQISKTMVGQRIIENTNTIEIREQDFFQYDGPICDAVVMGELLENVEKPNFLLEKVREITHKNSFICITSVVYGTSIGQIYVFKSVEEIEKMYREAGFEICDKIICPSHGYTIEKATERKATIMAVHILKKVSKNVLS